jgi:hypothetical protein
MSSQRDLAIRGAVYQYLVTEAPIAARRLRAQLDIADASAVMTDAELDAAATGAGAIAAAFGKSAKFSAVLTEAFAPAAPPKASPKPSPKLAPKASPKLAATAGARRARDDSSSDSDAADAGRAAAAPASTAAPSNTAAPAAAAAAPAKPKRAHTPNERFCRIDIESVKFADERLKDNRPGEEATSFLQNQKMMAVRGKEFTKHKQKNKAKLYAAGVDQTVRSVKFRHADDSD